MNKQKDNEMRDMEVQEQLEKNTEQYKGLVRDANVKKEELRKNIEHEEEMVRKMRDELADIQTENKNLNFVLQKTEQLAEEKAHLEEESLRMLKDDLQK